MATPGTQYVVFPETPMPLSNMTYFLGRVGVSQAGDYEIIYDVRGVPAATGTMTLTVQDNGVAIPATVITHAVTAGAQTAFSGDAIVPLLPGDAIGLAVSSSVANALQISPNVGVTLTLKKLDAPVV
jgi:hypothetical protein